MKARLTAPLCQAKPRQRLASLERLRRAAFRENLPAELIEAIDEAIDRDRGLYALQLGVAESPRAFIHQFQAAEQLARSLTSLHAGLERAARDLALDPRGEAARALLAGLFPQGLVGAAGLPGSLLYAAAGLVIDKAGRALSPPIQVLGLAPQVRIIEQRHAALGAALAHHDDQDELQQLNDLGQRALQDLARRCLEVCPGPDPESRAIRQAIAAALAAHDDEDDEDNDGDPRRPDF